MKKKFSVFSGGLRRKIITLVLLVLLLVSAAIIMVTGFSVTKLRRLIVEDNTQQREAISEIASKCMEETVLERAGKENRLQAYLMDTPFRDVREMVDTTADMVYECLVNPEDCSSPLSRGSGFLK